MTYTTSKLIQPTLPTAGEVTAMLLVADQNHERLQSEWFAAWERSEATSLNAEVTETVATSAAWGEIDGKNKEQRDAQLALALLNNKHLQQMQDRQREAQRGLKLVEIALESARVHRGALHDIARLVMAERLAEANQGLGALFGWNQS